MKLKKASESDGVAEMSPVSTSSTGGAVIADRFKLDVDPNAGKGPAGVGKTGSLIALICSLLSIGLLGVVAWLMYQNWELIKG